MPTDISIQVHITGEKTFVDYADMIVAVNDQTSGKPKEAQVFIAVIGALSYTYAKATWWPQSLPDWTGILRNQWPKISGIRKRTRIEMSSW